MYRLVLLLLRTYNNKNSCKEKIIVNESTFPFKKMPDSNGLIFNYYVYNVFYFLYSVPFLWNYKVNTYLGSRK